MVSKGSGGYNTSAGVSNVKPVLKMTCEEAIASFAAILPADYSPMLTVIMAYIGAAKANYVANGGTAVGAADADVYDYLKNTLYPASTLTQDQVTALITRGMKLGIFRLSYNVMCSGNPPAERVVCLDPRFGDFPQNKTLYMEMGSTPYYPFAIGLI